MSTTNTIVAPAGIGSPRPAVAVALVGRDDEQDLRPDRLADQALVPARDHRSGADVERGGLSRVSHDESNTSPVSQTTPV